MQKSASFQRAMLKPRNSRDHDETQDSVNLDDIGKEDLQRYHSPDRVRLKVKISSIFQIFYYAISGDMRSVQNIYNVPFNS